MITQQTVSYQMKDKPGGTVTPSLHELDLYIDDKLIPNLTVSVITKRIPKRYHSQIMVVRGKPIITVSSTSEAEEIAKVIERTGVFFQVEYNGEVILKVKAQEDYEPTPVGATQENFILHHVVIPTLEILGVITTGSDS